MPRCCGGAGCACLIQSGDEHLVVAGDGSAQNAYVISTDIDLEVSDSTVFDLTLNGEGTDVSPWILSLAFASTAKLDDLPDVNAPSPSNNHVLGYDTATGKWTNRAPTTASPGAITTDTGLVGDGSGGSPLGVNEDPAGFLATGASGLGLSTTGKRALIQHFGNDLSRAAALTSPGLNQVTMLDDHPGQQDYWTGTQWEPVNNGITRDWGGEVLALSGPYVDGLPLTLFTRQISALTGSDGSFDLIDPSDLLTASGVLSCFFQETDLSGTTLFKAMVRPNGDRMSAFAYNVSDGSLYASQQVTGTVMAYIY